MARPNRQGVDYFPLDVHLDDKFKFVEIKYKLEGFGVVIKLIQKLYSYGYWYKWTEDEKLILSDELRVDYELVNNVVNECLERGIFDSIMYENYSILTSKGIQKRYKEMVRRRKDVELTEEYLLIDDMVTTLSKHDDDTQLTTGEQDDVKSTQSKVNRKESKVKEKESKEYTVEFEEWWNIYPKKSDKQDTAKRYIKARQTNSQEDLLNGLLGYLEEIKKDGTEKKFIKLGSTFLNKESFKDYLTVKEEVKRVDPKEKLKKASIERVKVLEAELSKGKQHYMDMGKEHLFSKNQEELGEINERLRNLEEEDRPS